MMNKNLFYGNKIISFNIEKDGILHGFGGYFDCNLFNNINGKLIWNDYPLLEFIYIRKNSFQNVASLVLSNIIIT